MKHNLFIFIGGSDDKNGDYSAVHRLARRGGTANWSCLKSSQPGDRALIYIQSPHSALVAKAEVLANPVKSNLEDYAYRAKTGRFELLPNRVCIQDLKREFPRWAWLRYPRGKAVVPDKYAKHLWRLVHDQQSHVQILISNAGIGKQLLEKMADTGRSAFWSAPRLTAVGDTAMFYIEEPVSAIVAVGEVLTPAKATSRKWYEAKIGKVRLLKTPITLAELRAMFPDWAWLRSVNMFAYVSPERAKSLMKRCALKSSPKFQERESREDDPIKDFELASKNFKTLKNTEREALRKSRIGQGKFRELVLSLWKGGCAVTGVRTAIILGASHIKPWMQSTDKERLDGYNGLALVPNLDKAFDRGLITFDDSGHIKVSSYLTARDARILGITKRQKLCKVPAETKKYLRYHRSHVYLGGIR